MIQSSLASLARSLVVRIGRKRLDVVVWSPSSAPGKRLEHLSVALAEPTLKAVEEAVYDMPDVAGHEWRCVTVLIESPDAVWLSSAEDSCEEDFARALGRPGADIMRDPAGDDGAVLLWHEPLDGLVAFARRTWGYDSRVEHSLAPLTRWAAIEGGRGAGRPIIYACLRGDGIDVVAVDGGRPVMAVQHGRADHADAAYYILAVRRVLDESRDWIVKVCGNPPDRQRVVKETERFTGAVMPVVFPSELFAAGKAAMEAPFDMIATLLL